MAIEMGRAFAALMVQQVAHVVDLAAVADRRAEDTGAAPSRSATRKRPDRRSSNDGCSRRSSQFMCCCLRVTRG